MRVQNLAGDELELELPSSALVADLKRAVHERQPQFEQFRIRLVLQRDDAGTLVHLKTTRAF